MALIDEIARVVGSANVTVDPDVLARYANDHSFVQPRKPTLVAWAEDQAQIQEVVKYANETSTPVTVRCAPRSGSVRARWICVRGARASA